MTDQCDHTFKDTGLAFCTIPEIKIQACTKCGEQRAYQEEPQQEKWIATDLSCDICGKAMMKQETSSSVIFQCSDCKQNWRVRDTGTSCTIVKHLWPSGMDENGRMFREEYLPERRKEMEFNVQLRFSAGLLDEAEKAEELREIDVLFKEWYAEHPLPAPSPTMRARFWNWLMNEKD